MKIMIFIGYYLPAYKSGGPVRSIANMVAAMAGYHEFLIVTRDRDSGDTGPYPHAKVGDWTDFEGQRIRYLAPQEQTVARMKKLIEKEQPDLLYLNSLFDPLSSMKPLMARRLMKSPPPVAISVRGECSPSALAIKPYRKRAYLAAARYLGLFRDTVFAATSDYEAADIARALPGLPVNVAADLGPLPGTADGGSDGPLHILTVARLSPIKNIPFAIAALSQVTRPVRWTLVGPRGTPDLWPEYEARIAKLPEHVEARYHGDLPHPEVGAIMKQADLFFLPSKSENYGQVIAEALSASTPVLIGDKTPWRGLEDKKAGFDLPLDDPARFAALIDALAAEGAAARTARREDVAAAAKHLLGPAPAIAAKGRLFRSIVGSR